MFLKVSLLLGLIVLGPHVYSAHFVDVSKRDSFFAICVEFAIFEFNQAHLDEYAYKLLWVGRSQRKVSGVSPSQRLHVGLETRLWRGESLVCKKEQRVFFRFRKYFLKCKVSLQVLQVSVSFS